MATKSRKPVDEFKPRGVGDVLFINVDLDKNQRQALREWSKSYGPQTFEMIDRLLEAGYNLSLKRDTYNEAFSAFLTAPKKDNANSGFILTSRASGSMNALMGLLFRHYVLFEEDWPEYNRPKAAFDDDN